MVGPGARLAVYALPTTTSSSTFCVYTGGTKNTFLHLDCFVYFSNSCILLFQLLQIIQWLESGMKILFGELNYNNH